MLPGKGSVLPILLLSNCISRYEALESDEEKGSDNESGVSCTTVTMHGNVS